MQASHKAFCLYLCYLLRVTGTSLGYRLQVVVNHDGSVFSHRTDLPFRWEINTG